MLQVTDLSFGYIPGQDVFRDVSFSVEAGEFIALGGRNGCGKTTLTRLLVGLEKPRQGRILYKNQDITQMPPAQRGQFIGYVFQQPDRQMFRNRVFDEVAFGPQSLGHSPEQVEQEVLTALEVTGISHLQDEYPPALRRGEKQKVAIASALAMQSHILILDEPTSGQDGTETKALMDLLQKLNQEGLTILLITHDMDIMAAYCDRCIVIGQGTKAFDGTTEELFTETRDLAQWGLAKPACVALAEAVPGLGYCKTMDEFKARFLAYRS